MVSLVDREWEFENLQDREEGKERFYSHFK